MVCFSVFAKIDSLFVWLWVKSGRGVLAHGTGPKRMDS